MLFDWTLCRHTVLGQVVDIDLLSSAAWLSWHWMRFSTCWFVLMPFFKLKDQSIIERLSQEMSTALSPVTASRDCHRLETPCAYACPSAKGQAPRSWPLILLAKSWIAFWNSHSLRTDCLTTGMSNKENAQTQEADQECFLLAWYQFHMPWNWKFTLQMNLLFKSTPDSCIILFGTHQWCPVLHDMIIFCMLCMAKQF